MSQVNLTGSVTICDPNGQNQQTVGISDFSEIQAWPLEYGEAPAVKDGKAVILRQFRFGDSADGPAILVRALKDWDDNLSINIRTQRCAIEYSDLSFGEEIA